MVMKTFLVASAKNFSFEDSLQVIKKEKASSRGVLLVRKTKGKTKIAADTEIVTRTVLEESLFIPKDSNVCVVVDASKVNRAREKVESWQLKNSEVIPKQSTVYLLSSYDSFKKSFMSGELKKYGLVFIQSEYYDQINMFLLDATKPKDYQPIRIECDG